MTDNVVDFDIRLLRKRHKELDSMIWELEGQDLAETHVRLTELKKEKLDCFKLCFRIKLVDASCYEQFC